MSYELNASSHRPPTAEAMPSSVRAALVLVIVSAVALVVQTLGGILIPTLAYASGLPVAGIGLVFSAMSIVIGLISAVTLVLGLVALRAPSGRAIAGAAIGVGGFGVLGVVVGFLGQAVATLASF